MHTGFVIFGFLVDILSAVHSWNVFSHILSNSVAPITLKLSFPKESHSQNYNTAVLNYCLWELLCVSIQVLWYHSRWCHQMETFFALLAFCVGNSPVTGEFPTQRPVTLSFEVFFGLCLNKQMSKQWRRWWLETLLRSLRRHYNV